MEQDPDQAGRDDGNAPTAGLSSLDFNFLDDYESEQKRWKERLNQRKMKLPRWNLRQPS